SVGASLNPLASAYLYDPSTNTWTPTGSMQAARFNAAAVLLPDGKVLITGGFDASGAELDSTEVYDPSTGFSSAPPTMSAARARHTATLLPNGKVLVV